MDTTKQTTEYDPAAVQGVVESLRLMADAVESLTDEHGPRRAFWGDGLARARAALADLNSATPRELTLDEARAKVEAMVPKGWQWALDDCQRRDGSGHFVKKLIVYARAEQFGMGDGMIVDSLPAALAWFERVISERGAK